MRKITITLHSRAYEDAMKRFFAQKPVKLKRPADRYLGREQANDRAGLRRRCGIARSS
jgi:hypothetical protein